MKRLIGACAVLFCVLCLASAQIVKFSGKLPPCSATAPNQAIAAGYHTLGICNALTDNSQVDANNTLNPWFLWYPTGYNYTLPPNELSNDGTGLTVLSTPSEDVSALYTTANNGPNVAGNTITGGFYAEMDMKINSAACQAPPNAYPSFWMVYYKAPLYYSLVPAVDYTEIDAIEFDNCNPITTIHDWPAGGGAQNCQNSNNSISFSPGNGFNTYGILFIPSSSGGGTGTVEWFINNNLVTTVTYSPSSKPSPAGSCPIGAFASADAQAWTFVIQSGTNDPVTFRNFHVWQAP